MAISQFDIDNIDKIMAAPDNDPRWSYFTCLVLRLFQHADMANVAMLASAYPAEAAAYQAWLLQQTTNEAGITRQNIRALVRAARAALPLVDEAYPVRASAKRALAEALAPFQAVP